MNPPSTELLKAMDDSHAINAIRADLHPLTTTDLERYLLDRLEALLDDTEGLDKFADAAENHDLTPENIESLGDALVEDTDNTVALLKALGEAGITEPDQIREMFNLAEQFRKLAEDAGDVFTRLNSLIEQEQ